MYLRFPVPSLILLVGPSGSGKSAWAEANFREGQVLSSDHFRAFLGTGPHDQRVSKRAFELLDQLVAERLDAGLLTIVDSLGLNRDQRDRHRTMATSRGIPVFAVGFDTPPKLCRERNDARGRPVPAGVLNQQLKRWVTVRDDELGHEGYEAVHILMEPMPVHTVPTTLRHAPALREHQAADPKRLSFGLQLARFPWDPNQLGSSISAVARAAEDVGFDSLWVMDHLRQIPLLGRAWDPLPEAYTTLSFAAAATERIRLGALVTAITYRNVGLLGKMIATLDVLSGGRAICGLGAGWFQAEAEGYGYEWDPPGRRLDILEDALRVLPLLWGPGSRGFTGKVVSLPETMCYPRPFQEKIPILVGGGGERRTLRLVAEYANAANLFGDPDQVRHKLEVLQRHCADVGRNPDDIEVTVLTNAVTAHDPAALQRRLRTMAINGDIESAAVRSGGATVEDQIGRFRSFADVGVDTMILSVADLTDVDDLEPYREVIAAFR